VSAILGIDAAWTTGRPRSLTWANSSMRTLRWFLRHAPAS